ncbi:DUF6636 domain-containing protein [Mesorhizobium sp. 1M-11]|uniref:DUF6636 domain-containing protein n=1 Tax=Mesorhizobium sp. 1M-11 TaxID=1529006 RepID=UPI0006C76A0A|nr:DUF6636 domain-containing protein [Mesorhizobium sp. 1M-11]
MIILTKAAVCQTAAFAQEPPKGFRSPTGNIQCLFYDVSSVRCSIATVSNRLAHRPADCELEWGHDFGLEASSKEGEYLCVGDTIADDYPVLPYGESARHGAVTCRSARKGVTCTNIEGAGFELSRSLQRVF